MPLAKIPSRYVTQRLKQPFRRLVVENTSNSYPASTKSEWGVVSNPGSPRWAGWLAKCLGLPGGRWGPERPLMAFVRLPQESTLAHFMLIPPGQPVARLTDMLIQLPVHQTPPPHSLFFNVNLKLKSQFVSDKHAIQNQGFQPVWAKNIFQVNVKI